MTSAAEILTMPPERRAAYGLYTFRDLTNAISFTHTAGGMYLIVMGDCPVYWVCKPRLAYQLIQLGYEFAE